MSEDNTKKLTDGEKMILAELHGVKDRLSAVETRLGALEAAAEDRARETRPKLDHLIKEVVDMREGFGERIGKVEKAIKLFGYQMDVFTEHVLELRHGYREHETRLDALEQKPN